MNDFSLKLFYIIFSLRDGGNIPLGVKSDIATTSEGLMTSGGTCTPIMSVLIIYIYLQIKIIRV